MSEQESKLKDLAQSLSEELGAAAPPVAGAPANPAATAPPTTPPSESASPVAPVTPSPESSAPTTNVGTADAASFSFEELDNILKEQDPGFFEDMEGLKKSAPPAMEINSIQLDTGMLEEDEADEPQAAAPPKPKSKIGRFVHGTKVRAEKTVDFIFHIGTNAKWVAQKFVGALQSLGGGLKNGLVSFGTWFQSRTILQQIQLLIFIALLVGSSYFVKHVVTGAPFLKPSPPTFLRSFEPVAGHVETYSSEDEMELFDNPLRQPEYIVLYGKMRVNLKVSSRSSPNPMAAFEVFVEGSSQEAAMELKDRELEMRDVIARVFESLPYDEILEFDGKEKLKLIIRRDINREMTKGRAKKVYFKTLFYKP
ncbi:MAG: flagellar basal body-associated protein FliL [Bdellovibrionales bacterium]